MYSCCGFHHAVQQVVIKVLEENASFLRKTETSQVRKQGGLKRAVSCSSSNTAGCKT